MSDNRQKGVLYKIVNSVSFKEILTVVFNPIQSFLRWKHKGNIERLIFQAEEGATAVGRSAFEFLKEYSEADLNPYLKKNLKLMVQKIVTNKENRLEVYKEWIEPDIYDFLKSASEKNIPVNKVISTIKEAKEQTDKYIKNIRRQMIFPMLLGVFIIIILGYAALELKESQEMGGNEEIFQISTTAKFILNNYILLNFIFLISVFVFTYKFLHKMPKFKKVFELINSMMALEITRAMYKLNFDSKDIIFQLRKRFKYYANKKTFQNVEELILILNRLRFIDETDAVSLKIAISNNQQSVMLDTIIEKKKEETKQLVNMINQAIESFSKLILAFPVFTLIYVFLELMKSSVNIFQMGNNF